MFLTSDLKFLNYVIKLSSFYSFLASLSLSKELFDFYSGSETLNNKTISFPKINFVSESYKTK